jgi:ethanolamine ammonia-lyase large subunit
MAVFFHPDLARRQHQVKVRHDFCDRSLSSRLQPNHPTDSPEGIRASIYEGLSYGCGDSVIGINPSDDSYGSVARLLEMTYEIIKDWEIPSQNCVLDIRRAVGRGRRTGREILLAKRTEFHVF